jgi:CRP/FNR family transcriptional regulator
MILLTLDRTERKRAVMGCVCEEIAGKDISLSPVCIGHLWIFKDLESKELEALTASAMRKQVAKGNSLFIQGDSAEEMFLIKGGRVKLSKLLENGTEITLDIRKAGDFVGENMLSEETDYPVSALCIEDALACGFSRERFQDLILRYPNIGLQIIKNMSERISWLTNQVGSMAVTNIEDRLYRVLVNVAKEHGIKSRRGLTIQFPLTHEDLSFLIGAHRVSVTRAINLLKKSGKIISEGKSLTLPLAAV